MSSISATAETELVTLFEREFVAAARRLAQLGIQPIEDGFDYTVASYYVVRERPQLDIADFELNLDDLEDVKRRFRKQWTEAEAMVLEGLLDKILALSPACDSVEESTDVSPFIYAMF